MPTTKINPVQRLLYALKEQQGDRDIICCRLCKAAITSRSQQTVIGTNHRHHFTNPAGISYGIACYHHAAGCSISGQPTEQDSWFGGYRWQMAQCSECNEHLGWYYQNDHDRFFFGLIVDRLIDTIE